ncbi:ATP-binding cassette domain-containing protein [Chitinophaga silvatica]|uniref:ATP-binding cassette domain-containing protein n=1 Tax=Chitinophaga silvatica TaxID=2282649 RepID=A0A3E1YGM3_9BACT|nr:ATP-binding cassette domain-containing protein [Chitinophaga silvatica]RFS26517.1 ATP-binding cassette domain-containing protein [Chitinophaga silvatica]
MIKLSHVTKFFESGTEVVKDLSFDVADGETLVLLGTSGGGKTTTLRMINRLIDPDKGEIYINNQNIKQLSPISLRRKIGYVLQNTGLFPHYTVLENIGVVPTLLQWDKSSIEKRSVSLMEKLRLSPSEYANVYPHQLSGGQQQRVGLARALAADPPILLMDEPFGALDPLTRISVRKEFKNLDEIHNKIVILVTHDVEEAFELGTRIGLMNNGVMQQLGTPGELLFQPANDFVKSFLKPQQLELELRTVILNDIAEWLPDEDNEDQPSSLQPENTCWDALEQVSNQPATIQLQGKRKLINGNTLLQGIANYKNTYSHGRK